MDWQKLEKYFWSLDRSLFVGDDMKKHANIDAPLPIGFGQTISQPSLVLEMTRLLEPKTIARYWRLEPVQVFRQPFLQKCQRKFIPWKELMNWRKKPSRD